MRLQRTPGTGRRRGIILLVVLVMLILFSIAGLTFVLYAEGAAGASVANKDAETHAVSNSPDMDPNASLDYFLGQLIYGVSDPTAANPNNGESVLRGHSLAENLYGGYDSMATVPSDVPFNGTGWMNQQYPIYPSDNATVSGLTDSNLVNYMYFAADGFVRDPSRPGTRANPSAARTTYTGGQNPPYTYPDTNCMFLASINQTSGQLVTPSFHRPANFAAGDWSSTVGKYKTLVVRPVDMAPGSLPQFDPTTGCSVKNLSGSPGGPDSPWIDVGGPELYTASGLRYKMLVAPLIIDMDNRVNLNVHGNIFAENGPTNRHSSNQAWGGAWHVNISRVLNTSNTEWQNLFLGNGGVTGRYGSSGLPANVYPLNGPTPHVYFPGDLNGVGDPGQAGAFMPTPAWSLPSGVSCFPTFPSSGYGNNIGGIEIQNSGGQTAHPMFFNPLSPSAPNRLLPLFSHATLMYGGPLAAANLDLGKLCPGNFTGTGPNAGTTIKRIHETTLLSMDLDRAGASPYVWDSANPSYNILYNPTTGSYGANDGAQPTTFPPLSSRGATPANSDFDPTTWRSVLPRILPRTDLDRILAPYPASGVQPLDRQQFAMDIYTRLLAATGMTGVYSNLGTATPPSTAQYLTLRWLAQLSANIVDYIDTDDVMTSFQWAQPSQVQPPDTGYVFGTELPKLVLNEVYLQYNNDPLDPVLVKGQKVAGHPYQMNVWAELVNPLPPSGNDAAINGPNDAVLVNPAGSPLYQIVLSKPNSQASVYGAAYPKGMRRPENLVGDPDNSPTQPYTATGNYSAGQVLSVVSSLAAGPQVVTPMGSSANDATHTNQGYYVIGPSTDATVSPTSYQTPADATFKTTMAYTVPLTDPSANQPVPPTLLLQRLANPKLGFNATTNPYITVDYVDMSVAATVNDARTYSATGLIGAASAVDTRYSFGRTQPYAAAASQLQKQPHNASGNGQPSDTFYSVNSPAPASGANNWLLHMDRPLISPVELAGVSAFKPHELTQQFYANGNATDHLAPWGDQNSRLFRLLEFVKVTNTTAGIVAGGRIPGRINLNTLDATINPNTLLPNSVEVFRALCDAEPGNLFYGGAGAPDTTVDAVFQALMAQRTPGGTPGPNDRPFQGMAPGTLAQTFLGSAATNAGGAHPYQQLELLNKIYNNSTTRSNVFAVWLTVGFFEITDDQTTPMKLGPEINAAQGKNIRHHMFAMIDRTQITTFTTKVGGGGVTASYNAGTATWNPVGINVPTAVTDARTTATWNVVPGTTLVYDPGAANEETVVVQNGNTAAFTQSHAAGATVVNRGNPGPWTKYDPAQDGSVVPYSVIID